MTYRKYLLKCDIEKRIKTLRRKDEHVLFRRKKSNFLNLVYVVRVAWVWQNPTIMRKAAGDGDTLAQVSVKN